MSKKTEQITDFGLHFMLDMYNCDPKVLDDANYLYHVLDDLPAKIDMRQLTKPCLVTTPGNGAHDPGGWSGFIIIEESHISLHTFVKRKFVTIDVYSCKKFDTDKTLAYFEEKFKSKDVELYIQPRGVKYPTQNLID
jgi:S-adenosylmethionine decarboxylase